MSTPAVYTLLRMERRSGTVDGWSAPTGRRTGWTATLDIGEVETSVTVVLESSPSGLSGTWSTLTNFGGAKTTTGRTQESTADDDFTVDARDTYIRARVSAATDNFTLRVTAAAPFIDPTDPTDTELLSQELREWDDGLHRTVERAERDVLSQIKANPATGELNVPLELDDAYGEIRAVVAEQADWLHYLHELRQRAKSDATAMATLRDAPDVAPGLMDRIRDLQPPSVSAWRGR